MKKVIKGFIVLTLGVFLSIGAMAQPDGRPGAPPVGFGLNGNQAPGDAGPAGAPIAPGTGIFLVLALGYGVMKVLEARKLKKLPE